MSDPLDQQLRQATDALTEAKTRLRTALIEHTKAVHVCEYAWYQYTSFHVRRGAKWNSTIEHNAAVYRANASLHDWLHNVEVELSRARSEVEIAEAKWHHIYLQIQASRLRG